VEKGVIDGDIDIEREGDIPPITKQGLEKGEGGRILVSTHAREDG